MDEWLSDREHGGFYASQDADYSMDDDGDYFTWTLEEAKSVLTEEEARAARLHYDINEIGEMHHNPAKNVLYQRASVEEISKRLSLAQEEMQNLLRSAKNKMYAARLKRPTPYVDKTVYTGWNALCVSAYLEAAKALNSKPLNISRYALWIAFWPRDGRRRMDCCTCWLIPTPMHNAGNSRVCWTITLSLPLPVWTHTKPPPISAISILANGLRTRWSSVSSIPFPAASLIPERRRPTEKVLGVLGTRRKPFQDSPTPAGNSVAAIALLRLHAYTNDAVLHEKAEQTIELIAGLAAQYGFFAATYGIAAVHLSHPHMQIVIVGNDELADRLYHAAVAPIPPGKLCSGWRPTRPFRKIFRPPWPRLSRNCQRSRKEKP